MPSLSDDAKEILRNATEERKQAGLPYDRTTIADLYDTYSNIVFNSLNIPGFEMGTTTARKIIRAEIAHIQARKTGQLLQRLDAHEKYKGMRETKPGNSKQFKKKWGGV